MQNEDIQKDCIFCKIVQKNISSEILFEDEEILAFKDINPQAPVHILIIPKKHIDAFNKIDEGHTPLCGKLITTAVRLAKKLGISKSGYRIIGNCGKDGGQLVFHLHIHLLGGRVFHWPPG